jgi:hypothetical protein
MWRPAPRAQRDGELRVTRNRLPGSPNQFGSRASTLLSRGEPDPAGRRPVIRGWVAFRMFVFPYVEGRAGRGGTSTLPGRFALAKWCYGMSFFQTLISEMS